MSKIATVYTFELKDLSYLREFNSQEIDEEIKLKNEVEPQRGKVTDWAPMTKIKDT